MTNLAKTFLNNNKRPETISDKLNSIRSAYNDYDYKIDTKIDTNSKNTTKKKLISTSKLNNRAFSGYNSTSRSREVSEDTYRKNLNYNNKFANKKFNAIRTEESEDRQKTFGNEIQFSLILDFLKK